MKIENIMLDMIKGLSNNYSFMVNTIQGETFATYETDIVYLRFVTDANGVDNPKRLYLSIKEKIKELRNEDFEERKYYDTLLPGYLEILFRSKVDRNITKDAVLDLLNELATFMRAYL